ncbi:MAG: SPFH domain-containing protein [Terriglobia bacterium]|jgi:regulator of protease activity HflC (stomatin/prohibitin superfamily)
MATRYFRFWVVGWAFAFAFAASGVAAQLRASPPSDSSGNAASGSKAPAKYLGCYLDKQVRDLQVAAASGPDNAACQAYCGARGFLFAATQWGSQCFCGNSYGRYGRLPESSCNLGCSGNPSEKCGGWWASSVYEVGKPNSTAAKPGPSPQLPRGTTVTAEHEGGTARRASMAGFMTFLFVLIILFGIGTVFSGLFTVATAKAAVVQRFGRFVRVAGAGLNFKLPWIEQVVAKVDLRVQQLDVKMETKTKDNVFVSIPVSVQYHVLPDRVYEAYYKLSDPKEQIGSFVFNVILGHVPKMILDEAFEQQNAIATAVKQELDGVMAGFGYGIVKALVTDIIPDPKVKAAMNDINAARREQEAANARGEAEKILKVKQAEAEALSKQLQGQGIANQRKAIIDGLRESVETFKAGVEGTSAKDVMMLVLLTQYFDTLKEIGASSHSNTIMMPHSPGGMVDFFEQIRNAVVLGDIIGGSAQQSASVPYKPGTQA